MMPIQLRLAVLATAAVIAAAAQQQYLKQRLQTAEFVSVARDVKMGAKLSADDLAPITLATPAPLASLLIPWAERMLVIRKPMLQSARSGALLIRRDFEKSPIGQLRQQKNEYLFSIDLAIASDIQHTFPVGSQLGFLVQRSEGEKKEVAIEHCGPFKVRKIGEVTERLDPQLMQLVRGQDIWLSTPKRTGEQQPDLARQLIGAARGEGGNEIIGLYYPDAE